MLLRKLFPQALALCFALGLFSFPAFAQTGETRVRVTPQNADTDEATVFPDPIIISTAAPEDLKSLRASEKTVISAGINREITPSLSRFQPLILAAIDQRLGSRYVWGATGPYTFDCSGFVWSIFQSAGINFERGSARTLWSRFAPSAPEEQYKFGTLVFFSNLAHVGVVADEHGFYHASRHHGVIYSPFSDYWVSRIDGFRRVPLPTPLVTD
jgi:cell wall-associated NlpC family hydrolase